MSGQDKFRDAISGAENETAEEIGERLANELLDALDEKYPNGGNDWYEALDVARLLINTLGDTRPNN